MLFVIRNSKISRTFFRVIVDLLSQKSLSLHPLLIHLLRCLVVSLCRVNIFKPSIFSLFVDQIRADKLKSISRSIALNSFSIIIIPDGALQILINGDKRIMPIKIDANYGGSVMIKKFTKLMNLHLVRNLLVLDFY